MITKLISRHRLKETAQTLQNLFPGKQIWIGNKNMDFSADGDSIICLRVPFETNAAGDLTWYEAGDTYLLDLTGYEYTLEVE